MFELEDIPELVNPVMVTAFAGWNDAGEAATAAVRHLQETWSARRIGALDPEDYYDYQVNRPTVSVDEGGVRRLDWPETTVSVARVPGLSRDVVLVRGIEPSIRWRAFTREVLEAATALKVEMVVTMGALLADVPHSRPVQVTGSVTDPSVGRPLELEVSRYTGPTGIVGVLQHGAQEAGIASVSLWAAVPHYVSQPPCPKATVALLRRVEDLLDIAVPMGDLPEQARAWERGVAELAAEDPEVAEYIQSLEAEHEPTELPEASGDAIAKEFEKYLRRRERGER